MPRRRHRGRAAVTAIALAAITVVAGRQAEHNVAEAAQAQPNILLVISDDQSLKPLGRRLMPNLVGRLEAKGTTFTDSIVTTPQCCPSRAGLLTGRYGHNNGVLSNQTGYPALRHRRSVLPVWLRDAGYRTGHIGKFLNHWEDGPGQIIPPGWSSWATMLAPWSYFDYRLSEGNQIRQYGSKNRDYLGRVITRRALGFLNSQPQRRPFYLQVDYFAPHAQKGRGQRGHCASTAVPDSRDQALTRTRAPRGGSFNERDISDKPPFIAGLPRLSRTDKDRIGHDYGCRAASLKSVDRGLGQILAKLRKMGEASSTVVVYASDNGFFEGQHRIPKSKILPYEEALRVPTVIRVPAAILGVSSVRVVDRLVGNIDLAPTLLDLAGEKPCRRGGQCAVFDGRSLVPLIRGDESRWPPDRGLAVEYSGSSTEVRGPLGAATPCDYFGIRTESRLFVKYTRVPDSGDRCRRASIPEHYDLDRDPMELRNLHPPAGPVRDAAIEAGLSARAESLRECRGAAGVDVVANHPPCE